MRLSKREYWREVQEILRLIRTVQPFEDTSAKARKERKQRAKKDKLWFFRTYFPHYFTLPFCEMHREVVRLMDTRGEGVPATVVVAAPRGHGKSTLVSLAYPIHQILFQGAHFIVLVSATADMAERFVMRIRLEFENNVRIRTDFGDLRGHPWSDEELVANQVMVWARGSGQALRGAVYGPYRPDLFILDDVETDELVRNPRRVERLKKWILGTVYPAMAKDGLLFMIGTKLSRRSVLAQFLEDKTWLHAEYRAIITDKPLWQEKFTIDQLNAMKEKMGTLDFNREYMNDPRDEEGMFKQEWIQYYEPETLSMDQLSIYAALDPSVGAGESSDYKAFVTIGVDPDGIIYVLDAWIRKASIEEMIRMVYAKWHQYRHLVIGIETNVFQRVLLNLFDMEARKRAQWLPLKEVQHSIAKEARIVRLSPLIERGVIRFAKGHSDQDLLIEQLIYFPSSTVNDDGPDALEMVVQISDLYAGRFEAQHYRSEVVRGLYGY